MKFRAVSGTMLTLLLTSMLTLTFNIQSVTASSTALRVIFPNGTSSSIGEYFPPDTFIVRLDIEAVTDLFGYEFKLKYKTDVLNATSITIGPFFLPGYLEWKKEINDTLGYVWYSATQGFGEMEGVTGSGTLAIISFTVDALGGSCPYLCDTILVNSVGNRLAHEVYDGHFVNAPVHDIGISSVTPSATKVLQGQTVDVTVVARNHGNFTESFNVTAYANTTAMETSKTVTGLAPGATTTLTFTWITTGETPGKYVISGNATTVSGETDTTDNTCNMWLYFFEKTYFYVTITVLGYPVAAFNYSPPTPVVNQTVFFDASDSTPNGGKINYYHWDFGDGETWTCVIPNITHVYEDHGTYTVTLIVEDSEVFEGEHLTDMTWKQITVYPEVIPATINVDPDALNLKSKGKWITTYIQFPCMQVFLKKWSYMTSPVSRSSPAIVDGIVYVGANNGFIYALDATTGAFIWSYPTGAPISSSPAVSGGIVYIGSLNAVVYALNATTGAFIWSYPTGAPVQSSPAVSGGLVYVGSFNGRLYALDAITGAYVWDYPTAGPIFLSSPAVEGDVVYVGSGDQRVYALDATTGAFIWSYLTGAPIYSSPAVSGGIIYIGSLDAMVYALDATTGAFIWSYSTFGPIYSSPAVGNGIMSVGSMDGRVYAFAQATINAEDIDVATILLNDTIQPVLDPKHEFVTNSSEYLVDNNEDGILERMVNFDKAEVMASLSVGEATLTITGEIKGMPFEGSDTIKAIDK